ncbi:hypothetical protein AMR42_14440 [Limnothrix sp. PR1529]|uniref:hypothetical protein n=1 Tax=Limnothrix sp. PR1529 TaxID=1704291 RepID=UPI00081E2091|nr:hypothetical protein [Limnothrix sp. PR1529]OCQ94018.1 hypothetical protein BCR12_05750 [Limnothrix sp. P13C2]PIB07318.1 hypothetical protein AMR42_14440 [Limnothrix sp. PR1529]
MRVKIYGQCINLSEASGSILVTKIGYGVSGNPSENAVNLAGAICQDFDNFFDYYERETAHAIYAEVLSVVYGREMG